MPTRRMFLTALAATAGTLGAGGRVPAASAAAGVDPGSVTALDAHLNHPRSGTGAGVGAGAAIPAMLTAGWQFVPLGG